MAKVIKGRMSADIEGDFVVFLIGMRFNKPWKIHKWWGTFTAMPRMLKTLYRQPELGFLGHTGAFTATGPVVIQYWRSPEQLEAFARNAALPHHPAWRAFNKAVGGNGDVGIWHETYLVKAGQYETVYGNMPQRWPGGSRRERAGGTERRNGGRTTRRCQLSGQTGRNITL